MNFTVIKHAPIKRGRNTTTDHLGCYELQDGPCDYIVLATVTPDCCNIDAVHQVEGEKGAYRLKRLTPSPKPTLVESFQTAIMAYWIAMNGTAGPQSAS